MSGLLAILVWTATGLPWAAALDRAARWPLLVSVAFFLGTGCVSGSLLILHLVGVPWSLGAHLGCSMALLAGGCVVHARGRTEVRRARFVPVWTDAGVLLAIAMFVFGASAAAPGHWDFWAIWGLKGRVFAEANAVDWSFLENPDSYFAHPDYPIHLPLLYAAWAQWSGGWDDRWMGLLHAAHGVATLVAVRTLLEADLRPLLASLVTLGLAGIALAPDVGLADQYVLAYGGIAALLIRHAERAGHSPLLGALLLGLAAFTKMEGETWMLAVAAGLAATRPCQGRRLIRLLPALAVAAPWMLMRMVHGLHNDLFRGSAWERLLLRLGDLPGFALTLAQQIPPTAVFWLSAAATVAYRAKDAWTKERLLTVAVMIQLAFYLGAFLITPYDLSWHVRTAWLRLLSHLGVPLGFLAAVLLAPKLSRQRSAGR